MKQVIGKDEARSSGLLSTAATAFLRGLRDSPQVYIGLLIWAVLKLGGKRDGTRPSETEKDKASTGPPK